VTASMAAMASELPRIGRGPAGRRVRVTSLRVLLRLSKSALAVRVAPSISLRGWPFTNAGDGNLATSYSSWGFSDTANTRGVFLSAYHGDSPPFAGPSPVSTIHLNARLSSSIFYQGFPIAYDVRVTNSTNTDWIFIGNRTNQPDESGLGQVGGLLPKAAGSPAQVGGVLLEAAGSLEQVGWGTSGGCREPRRLPPFARTASARAGGFWLLPTAISSDRQSSPHSSAETARSHASRWR
jgi:hypothetical protein